MIKRTKQAALAIAAIAALALGGSALAQAGSNTVTPNATPSTESASGPDTDNVQSGDQTTPDRPTAKASSSAPDQAGETPGNEAPETAGESGSEAPESAGESGSEKPGDDGPGGHADEPGNPNADHQFEGQE
jgi:hypothetical protein